MNKRFSDVQVVAEFGGWSMFIPGVPLAGEGATQLGAAEDFVDALRDYSEAWIDRLASAPNHSNNWSLVEAAAFASDEQLVSQLLAVGVQHP